MTGKGRPEPGEVQALFDRFGFVPDPACPPELLQAHRSLVYFILRAFTSDARPQAGLLAAVVEWYRRYDELADAQPTEQVFQYGDRRVRLRLACSAGCDHCCRSPVSAIGPEVVLIAEFIRASFTAPQRAALAQRMQARTAAIGDDPQRHHMCPLNVEGRCSVYAVRPLNCRKWHSFDESACRRRFVDEDPAALVPRAGVRGDSSGLIWQSVVAAFRVMRMDTAELDFARALALALAQERLATRFVAGEPLFSASRR